MFRCSSSLNSATASNLRGKINPLLRPVLECLSVSCDHQLQRQCQRRLSQSAGVPPHHKFSADAGPRKLAAVYVAASCTSACAHPPPVPTSVPVVTTERPPRETPRCHSVSSSAAEQGSYATKRGCGLTALQRLCLITNASDRHWAPIPRLGSCAAITAAECGRRRRPTRRRRVAVVITADLRHVPWEASEVAGGSSPAIKRDTSLPTEAPTVVDSWCSRSRRPVGASHGSAAHRRQLPRRDRAQLATSQ